jgi:hypothetical protein
MSDDRPRYRHWFRCRIDAHRFYVDRLTADSSKVKIPKCPKCGGKAKESFQADIGMDVSAGKAPATTSIQATAYDMALQMTMEDQKETDIRDNARPGENSAPKLPAHLQPLADNFWGGNRRQQKQRTARADLSPIFGARAAAAQGGQPAIGTPFTADRGIGIAPILTAKPEGSSPIPEHRVLGSYNPGRRG